MARIRTIKPEFFRHHKLFQAEKETKLPLRIAFAGLWTASDREGRFKWEPANLKLDCLPYDNLDFSAVLEALEKHGFIEKYTCEGRDYGWIPSFLEHQVVNNREMESKLPDPLDSSISTRGPRASEKLCNAQGEGKGKEGKGKEGDIDASPARQLFDIYLKENIALPDIKQFTTERRKRCNARIAAAKREHREQQFFRDFSEAVRKAQNVPFLRGESGNGTWKANFDWFIVNDTNIYKVLEGKYDDKQPQAQQYKKFNWEDFGGKPE